jgi:hypothetical protein
VPGSTLLTRALSCLRYGRVALAVPIALLAACAPTPRPGVLEESPPALLVNASDAGVRDLRGHYRAAVCRRLVKATPSCETVLRRLPGETVETTGGAASSVTLGALAQRYRIAFVPGFFSECFEGYARPFADVERALRAAGFRVDYFRVAGRGSVARNGARLAAQFRDAEGDPRPFVVFAYSKGLLDVLDLLVRDPQAARRVAAIVSVAGASNGSPLADNLLTAYRRWGASFPLPGCEPGQGDEIHDLRRDVRLEWWRTNGAAVTVPIFALVAAPRAEQVSPGTLATYNALARVSAANDGKLLWIDQIAPRSHLLGYANADHWAIAIPVVEQLPQFAFLFRDGVPRSALMEAAVEVVAATLESQRFGQTSAGGASNRLERSP